MRARVRVVVAVALGGAAIAACGSDDKGLSKAEFIKQADKICADHDKEVQEALEVLDPESTTDDTDKIVQLLLDEVLPIQRDKVADVRKLKPPNEHRDEVKKLLDEADAGTDLAEQTLQDDPDKALDGEFDPYKQANIDAIKYGFEECGSEV